MNNGQRALAYANQNGQSVSGPLPSDPASLTVAELRQIAQANGIDVAKRATKAKIIEAIQSRASGVDMRKLTPRQRRRLAKKARR